MYINTLWSEDKKKLFFKPLNYCYIAENIHDLVMLIFNYTPLLWESIKIVSIYEEIRTYTYTNLNQFYSSDEI